MKKSLIFFVFLIKITVLGGLITSAYLTFRVNSHWGIKNYLGLALANFIEIITSISNTHEKLRALFLSLIPCFLVRNEPKEHCQSK